MSGTQLQLKPYGAILAEKKQAAENHLKQFLPVVVFSISDGVYIFSDKNRLEKAYSTIVAAGAGRAFGSVCSWFREQLKELSLVLSRRDPAAEVETRILTEVFYPNLTVSGDIVLADIVIAEIAAEKDEDFIARIDFLGKETVFKGRGASEASDVVVISYRNIDSDNSGNGYYGRKKSGENNGSEDDVKNNECGEELNVANERLEKLKKEFADLGLSLPENFSDEAQVGRFLVELKEKWPGKKCFLDRKKVQNKQFDWIYREI